MGLIGTAIGIAAGGQTAQSLPITSGIKLRLRSDTNVTLVSGSVSQWVDMSGSGATFVQGTPTNRPSYTAVDAMYNGQPTMSFLASALQSLTDSTFQNLSQPATIYVVGESTSGGSAQDFQGNGATAPPTIYWSGSVWGIYAGSLLLGTNNSRSKNAFAGVFNSGPGVSYVGTSAAPNASGAAGSNSFGASGMTIGGYGAASQLLNGKIAELLIYSSAHSASQVSSVFKYFSSRYGGSWS
jgi:hypothetical protein